MDKPTNFLLNLFLLLVLVGLLLLIVPFWRHSSSFHVGRFVLPVILILIGGIGLRQTWRRLGQR